MGVSVNRFTEVPVEELVVGYQYRVELGVCTECPGYYTRRYRLGGWQEQLCCSPRCRKRRERRMKGLMSPIGVRRRNKRKIPSYYTDIFYDDSVQWDGDMEFNKQSDYRVEPRVCLECDEIIPIRTKSTNKQQVYCSNRCRQRGHRRRHPELKEHTNA